MAVDAPAPPFELEVFVGALTMGTRPSPPLSLPMAPEVTPNMRMSETALIQLVSDYFDSATDPTLLPPSAPGCEVRQNRLRVGMDGSCNVAPDGDRFEQVRLPVIDQTTGIVSAIVEHRGTIGMFLIRAQSALLFNIEVVGGAYSQTTGW